MSCPHIDGNAVWRVFKEENWCKNEMQPFQRKIIKPLVEVSPFVLEELLSKPPSLVSLLRAKILFLTYCLEDGLVEKMVAAVAQNSAAQTLGLLLNGDGIRQEFQNSIQKWQNILVDPEKFLASEKITENDYIFDSEIVGLNLVNLGKFSAGNLTIGDILLSQPSVILKC